MLKGGNRNTHFAKNSFVKNHKDDRKISGGSLCQE